MNRPSLPTPNQPPGRLPDGAEGPAAGGSVVLPDGTPGELAAMLPPGNLVIVGGPGSGKTALLEAAMHRLLAGPGGAVRFLTSSRQAAIASTERLLAALTGASGGELGCVTWYAFARALVTSHSDLLDYRGEPRPLSGPEQWALVRSLLTVEQSTVDWGHLAPLVDTRAFTDELAESVLACERRLIDPEDLALQDSVDQAGLVVQAGDLLEDHPGILAATAAQLGTLLVDEAQELDPAQVRLLALLVDGGARAVLAGDPAGTTDAFRGAAPGTLLELAGRLGATVVRLERSRRRPGRPPHRRRHHHRRGRPLPGPGRGGRGDRSPAPGRPRTRRHPLRPYGRAAARDPPAQRPDPPRVGTLRRPLPPGRRGTPARGRADRRQRAQPVPPGPRPGPGRRAAALAAHLPPRRPGRRRAAGPAPRRPPGRPLPGRPRPRPRLPPAPARGPAASGSAGADPGRHRGPARSRPGGRGPGRRRRCRGTAADQFVPGARPGPGHPGGGAVRPDRAGRGVGAGAGRRRLLLGGVADRPGLLRPDPAGRGRPGRRRRPAPARRPYRLLAGPQPVRRRPARGQHAHLPRRGRAGRLRQRPLAAPGHGQDRRGRRAVGQRRQGPRVRPGRGRRLPRGVPAQHHPAPGPVRGLAARRRPRRGGPGQRPPRRRAAAVHPGRQPGQGPGRVHRLAGRRPRGTVPVPARARAGALRRPAGRRRHPAGVPGGRRGPAPGGRRPGPSGRRAAGRRGDPGRDPRRRPGHLVVAPGLHRRPRADRRRRAPAHLLLADRHLRGLPPEVLLRQRGRPRRPLLLPDGLRAAHAHHLRAGRQGRGRQPARGPQGRLPRAVQPRLVPVTGHRPPVLARRHGHARAVAPQRGRGRPPRPALRGRVRDGGRRPPGPGADRPGRPGPRRRHRPARLQDRPLPGVRGGGRALPPARHLLPGGRARPRARRPRPPGRDAAGLPGPGHARPLHQGQPASRARPRRPGRAAAPGPARRRRRRVLRPRSPRRLPYVRLQAHLPHVAPGRGVPGPGPSARRPRPRRHPRIGPGPAGRPRGRPGRRQRRGCVVSAILTGAVPPGVRAALRGQEPTPEQLAAITAPVGPVHVIAGAGSGKTAVMAARIVYLVERLRVAPASVLGLTFTNKAASELETRVREALADTAVEAGDEVTVDTYHAFAADLVKAYGIRVGVEVDADLLSEAQQYQILLGILDSERFEHLSVRTAGATIRKTLELASACADHVVPAERVVEASRRLLQRADEGERLPDWMIQAARERIELARLVERYAAEKRRRGRLDF